MRKSPWNCDLLRTSLSYFRWILSINSAQHLQGRWNFACPPRCWENLHLTSGRFNPHFVWVNPTNMLAEAYVHHHWIGYSSYSSKSTLHGIRNSIKASQDVFVESPCWFILIGKILPQKQVILISGGQTCPAFLQLVDLYWFHAHFLQTKVLRSFMGNPAVNKGQGLKTIHAINLSYASFSGKSPVHSKKNAYPEVGWVSVDTMWINLSICWRLTNHFMPCLLVQQGKPTFLIQLSCGSQT